MSFSCFDLECPFVNLGVPASCYHLQFIIDDKVKSIGNHCADLRILQGQ